MTAKAASIASRIAKLVAEYFAGRFWYIQVAYLCVGHAPPAPAAAFDPWRQHRDMIGAMAKAVCTACAATRRGGTKMRLAFSAACCARPAPRSVGTGGQLGAPRRDDIRDARFQRQLGVPPQVAGVDHVRVEVVDFAIEPQPPGIAVAGRLILAERLERLARSPLTGETGRGEIQVGRGIARLGKRPERPKTDRSPQPVRRSPARGLRGRPRSEPFPSRAATNPGAMRPKKDAR